MVHSLNEGRQNLTILFFIPFFCFKYLNFLSFIISFGLAKICIFLFSKNYKVSYLIYGKCVSRGRHLRTISNMLKRFHSAKIKLTKLRISQYSFINLALYNFSSPLYVEIILKFSIVQRGGLSVFFFD